MSRLIDAELLLEQMKRRKDYIGRPSDPVCLVEDAPTVDAVPVVRCKDCKWFRDSNGVDGFCYCDRIFRHVGTHWYCADYQKPSVVKPKDWSPGVGHL